MKPTIYDVANEAGVSISTVSKVLNNTGSIAEKTRKRVRETMRELNYQPSVVASVKKRIQTIGLLIPNIANPFMAEIARGIENHLKKFGFSLMICSTDNDLKTEIEYISILKQKYIDGIIIATGLKEDKAIKELLNAEIPVALLSRDVSSLAVDSVLVDDFLGGFEATEHLINLGHQKIAMITEDINFPTIKTRVEGYKQALEKAGLEYDESLVLLNNTSLEEGKQSTRKLLNLSVPPTAIFASTEFLAIGAIQAARELKVKVPQKLSIIGFDDTVLATICDPPLTTIAQPIHEMSEKVVELLIAEIENPKETKQRVVLSPKLVVRESTAHNEIDTCKNTN
ncbi:LacI family DNA-binding transcriptional regulator [Peribacillus frigoritolerans]|uniref:LacI family DNA-binding transcriptional regulator n=1 Tax=Peribacillus frigoritolerans TaxID=450367 RepID=UPI000FDB291D|nr:LacI family DNA-binding transcriptional regulator [Peribacillus frigoritolerans]AZV59263.1 LacI family transcriptional regulator [Peribacillus frigoritolerans]USK78321.1 LacI family transcriptional regulator [Peribacillus frigoritolerans]WJE45649.1 LacI family DNA-binding transcriptional regulator [Peribacillus frigoritolerans]